MRAGGKEGIRPKPSPIHSSAEVTKSLVLPTAYGASLIQFWVSGCSCPFSSHFHAINSYLSLIPGGKKSLLINLYASICHKTAIMQPCRFPFQLQLSEKLRMVFFAYILQCVQFRCQNLLEILLHSVLCSRAILQMVISSQSLQGILEIINELIF